MKNTTTEKFDIYAMITNRIIEQLENGNIPWTCPWFEVPAVSHATGKPYSLLNQMILHRPGEYLTFNQVKAEGGKVKKGAKSTPVVFWKMYEKEETDPETEETTVKVIPCLRYYNVFHIDDCEGIEPKYANNTVKLYTNATAEGIIENYKQHNPELTVNIRFSDKAYYSPSMDTVVCPTLEQYTETSEYYSTLFHELTHSTGHASRLDRKFGTKKAAFGSEDYSKEELVAEIGAASLVNIANLETGKSFTNSAAYIQSWIKALKNDTHMIVNASAAAEKAVNYILEGFTAPEDTQDVNPDTTTDTTQTTNTPVDVSPILNAPRKKGTFNTLIADNVNGKPKAVTVKGYIDNINKIGYYRKENTWFAIDMATGRSFGFCVSTYKEAVKQAADNYHKLLSIQGTTNYDELVKIFRECSRCKPPQQ